MDHIIELDAEEGWVRVEPGVVFETLNRYLESYDLVFPPDPSSGEFCTIGGMLANNSGGAHSVMYGTTEDYVLSTRMILPGGRGFLADRYDPRKDKCDEWTRAVADILESNNELITREKPRTTKNASGYNIWEAFDRGTVDMSRLVVGSEGTLGVFTEAKLKLVPLPRSQATAMFCFASLEEMAESVSEIKMTGASTIELLDRSLLDLLSCQESSKLLAGLPEEKEAVLLVEFSGQEIEQVEEKADACLHRVRDSGLSNGYKLAVDREDQDKLWEIRDRASSIFRLIHHPSKPLRFIEDGVVPVVNLPKYIKRLRDILDAHGMKATIFGHAGDGNVHVNPLVDLTRTDFRDVMRDVAREVVSTVKELGGALTGEHGDGRLRSPFLRQFYGDSLYDVFSGIKHVFDPDGILNPGIIVGREVELDITENLRYGYSPIRNPFPVDLEDVKIEADKCHGCGSCRVYCPPFTGLMTEEATARSKANLIREVLIGEVISDHIISDSSFKDVMGLCYNCKLCTMECPSQVDIPWLAILARSTSGRLKGFSLQDRFLMSSGDYSSTGRKVSNLSNILLRNRLTRGIMELTTGIHKDRRLPLFDGGVEDNFSSGTVGYTRGDIIYFPGCFASYHSRTGEYRSSLALLRALGYRVKVIDGICCGVARLTVGDLEGFKTRAGELIDRIDEVAQNGGKICFSSPSCLMCVREEYPRYLDGERAREVASRSFDILELIDEGGDLLWGSGEVDTGVEDVTLHVPCHLHTNGLRETFLRVMSNIPGVQVVDVNDRCCGLAGTFGLRKERFEQSMKIGMTLFRDLEKNHEVITPCGACKMQIEQGSQSKVAHPVQLIAKQCITETSKSHIEEVGCR
jgi:FAD/FMN-containing dehydrogenase/Fe-S oxidoreductase